MFTINPGEFKHKITIQKCENIVDVDNIPTHTWKDVLVTKAKVTNIRGDEYLKALGVGVSIDKTFYIRYSKNIEITTENQILYKNKVYNIVYVNNVKDLNKYIEIKAEIRD